MSARMYAALRDTLLAISTLQAHARTPLVPGMPVRIDLDTTRLYRAVEHVIRVYNEETTMKPDTIMTITLRLKTEGDTEKARRVLTEYVNIGEQLQGAAQRLLQGIGGDVAGVTVEAEQHEI